MKTHIKELEDIAMSYLEQSGEKPNFANRDFMNTVIIFQTALMDKMYDTQEYDEMDLENRLKMAESCGMALRKLIHTYTNLDTHDIENFI